MTTFPTPEELNRQRTAELSEELEPARQLIRAEMAKAMPHAPVIVTPPRGMSLSSGAYMLLREELRVAGWHLEIDSQYNESYWTLRYTVNSRQEGE